LPRPTATDAPSAVAGERHAQTRPLLTVVVPVYNQAGTIVENVRTIRDRVADGIDGPLELIVVSDGSIDRGEERLLEEAPEVARLIHYDRNLGKGFAVKTGALAAGGDYISYVDADLDLDPASIPEFLELAREHELDFVIGSKRHPGSRVDYPLARRVSSWLYQQLVRLLFRLDVRDTQVGLKVFRREVAEQVLPLLLVKQFAFDLELLAVANALGFRRIREQPIRLTYRFAGSGVRSAAVLLALVDTAAIFYRLRILGYYQRKRALLPEVSRETGHRPSVALIAVRPPELAYPGLETLPLEADTPPARAEAARRADTDVVAFLAPGAAPAGNWLETTVPFLANPEIAAVVTPSMTPSVGSLRERAAAAIQESRLGGGALYFRFTPGNLRFVDLYPGTNAVVRRRDLLELGEAGGNPHLLCRALADRGKKVLYTPESVVVEPRAPLFRPHLGFIDATGRARGREIRQHGLRGLSLSALPPVLLLAFAVLGWPLLFLGSPWPWLYVGVWAVYLAVVLTGAILGALRFRSVRVGALAAAGSVAAHFSYAVAVLKGMTGR
jgi:glycosyltransferase involved in cell wall biosynthesis